MNPNEYQCSACKGVFEKARSDEEAMQEAHDNGFAGMALAVVCDDCFKAIMGEPLPEGKT